MILAVAALVCALGAFVVRRSMPTAALALLACAALAAGAARAADAARGALAISVPLDGTTVFVCEGRLRDDPAAQSWGVRLEVELAACGAHAEAMTPAQGVVRLNASDADAGIAAGDRVRFAARFSLPREFRNPGSFSYREHLMVAGIAAVASAQGRVERAAGGEAGIVARILTTARQRVNAAIDAGIAMPARPVVAALATGSREAMTPALREAFSLAGLAHLLSISGLHVGYVALAVFLLVRFTLGLCARLIVRVPLPRIAAIVTIPAVWLFVAFTGWQIPAVRSGLMITVFLVGTIAGLRQDLLTTIAASAIAILAILPLSILDLSFQLSVSAVTGIALIAVPLSRRLGLARRDRGRMARALCWVAASAVVSFAATVATAPLVAYHFKLFTGIGLAANIAAIPFTGLILQPLAMLGTTATLAAPAAAPWLWHAAGWAGGELVSMAERSAELGAPLAGSWAPSAAEAVLAYAVVAILLCWRRIPRHGVAALSLAALVCLDITSWRISPLLGRGLEVVFLDVGQGDAALVRLPGGKAFLVDSGGLRGSEFDVGRNVVVPALLRLGVRRLDGIVITHPHHDHAGGVASVAAAMRPAAVWANAEPPPDDERGEWRAMSERLSQLHIPLIPVGRDGVAMESGGARFEILPSAASGELNDTSLPVIVTHDSTRVLMAGDLSSEGERRLMSAGRDLHAHVLKVGHHGSRDASSSAFLDAVRPAIAVISAGQRNRYRFPHRETLSRLDVAGARIYRTDLDGAIFVKSDGKEVEVSTYVSSEKDDRR